MRRRDAAEDKRRFGSRVAIFQRASQLLEREDALYIAPRHDLDPSDRGRRFDRRVHQSSRVAKVQDGGFQPHRNRPAASGKSPSSVEGVRYERFHHKADRIVARRHRRR